MSKAFRNIISCMSGASILAVAPVCFLSTSCSNDTVLTKIPRNIDGHDWFGVSGGRFTDNDYFVNEEEKTVKYWNARNFVAKNLIIPNYVLKNLKKYKVIIDKQCFSECAGLQGYVEFNDFQDEVPDQCFNTDVDLKALYMHQYPKRIGEGAFQNCYSLTNIYVHGLPNWTLQLENIGMFAFEKTSLSGQINFTNHIKSIGDNAFAQCSKIEEVNLQFANEELKTINQGAFLNCFTMHDIYLPSSIKSIGDVAFKSCTSLKHVHLTKEDMTITLGAEAFYGCSSFTNFSKKCSLQTIGDKCFLGNTHLEIDPGRLSGTTEIGKAAFSSCSFVTLTFDPNYSQNYDVNDAAFSDCLNLRCLDFSAFGENNIPQWKGTDIFASTRKGGTIRVSEEMCKETSPVPIPTDDWLDFFGQFGLPLQEEQGAWVFEIK